MIKYTENSIFHSRYQLKKVVGYGGMSSVWHALDTLSGTEVAIKIFSYSGVLDDLAKESFKNEFKLMYNLTFPFLFRPTHFDIEPNEQSPYLVSKFYSKGSADTIINKLDSAIEEKQIACFLHDAASALNYLHNLQEPIIHQDVKPDNFLIDDDGRYILSDFGVSIRKRATQLMNDSPKNVVGDSGYLAPERFTGSNAKPPQDIFSLGVTLYEILTGVLPFQHFGGRLLSQGYEVPSLESGFGYSSRINLICQHCMQALPEARPSALKLLEWANFYLNNNYWPVIPPIETAKYNGKNKFKKSILLFTRINALSLNEIDLEEVKQCLSDFKNIDRSTGEFVEIDQHIVALEKLFTEFMAFEKAETHFHELITSSKASVSELKDIHNQFCYLEPRLSSNFVENRLGDIERRIELLNIASKNKEKDNAIVEEEKKKKKAMMFLDEGDDLYQDVEAEVNDQIYSLKKINLCLKKFNQSHHLFPDAPIELRIQNATNLKIVITEKLSYKRRIFLIKFSKVAALIIILSAGGFLTYKFIFRPKNDLPINAFTVPTSGTLSVPISAEGKQDNTTLTKNELKEQAHKSNLELTNKNIKNEDIKSKIVLPPLREEDTAIVFKEAEKLIPNERPTESSVVKIHKVNYPPVLTVSPEYISLSLTGKAFTFSCTAEDNEGIRTTTWQQTSGEKVSMKGENTRNLTIEFERAGVYKFMVTVTDNEGMSSSKYVNANVSSPAIENEKKDEVEKAIEKKKRHRPNG